MANARMGRRPVKGNVLWPVLSAGKSRLGLVHRIEHGVISQDPQHFSPATWKFVTDTLYPWAMGIGLSMMNVFFICVFLKAASNLKENITLELVYRRDDPAGGLKCVDADGNAVDEDPVFHGIPDGRNGIGFPGTRFFHRRSGCRKCSVLVVYGIPIFLYRTDLWNADLFNLI